MINASSESGLDFRRVFPIFVLVFVDVLGLTVILPLLHLYAARFGGGALEVGLVAAAFPLAQLIGVPMMGAFSDRYGRKPLLLISQITTCIGFVILGLAGSLEMIVFSRLLDGLFGANIATAQAALTDVTTEETRTQGLGLIGAAFGIGFIVGPVLSIIALEVGGDLSVPAYTSAVYSFISILLTLFIFRETLPPSKRNQVVKSSTISPLIIARYLRLPGVNILLILMFAQQLVFFGFEALLGLFTLSRLGLLGQGNAIIFLVVGIVLVIVQVRFIGRWSRKYGDRNVVLAALGLLAVGLILISITPEVPHPLYVREVVEYELRGDDATDTTQAILGEIAVDLPENGKNGFSGIAWILVTIIPLAVGAGLIRPGINSLITKNAHKDDYGAVLGVSSAFVSAANALAPIVGGLLFVQYGATVPFFLFGIAMAILLLFGFLTIPNRFI